MKIIVMDFKMLEIEPIVRLKSSQQNLWTLIMNNYKVVVNYMQGSVVLPKIQ